MLNENNLEYYMNQFEPQDRIVGQLGCCDFASGFAYLNCDDKDKFIEGFREWVYANPGEFLTNNGWYSVDTFRNWIEENKDKDIFKAKSWKEFYNEDQGLHLV